MESKSNSLTEDFFFVGPDEKPKEFTTFEQEAKGLVFKDSKKVFQTYGTKDSIGVPVSSLLYNLVRFNGYGYVKKDVNIIELQSKVTIEIIQGDVYTDETDSIVNMKANSNLDMDGQDRQKYSNVKDCQQWVKNMGTVKTGAVGISQGDGKIKTKKVIHAVPPIFKNFSQKVNETLLTALVINILEMARTEGLKSVSIPALSKEIGMPMEDCAYILLSTAARWCGQGDIGALKQIRFCNKDAATTAIFNSFFGVLFKEDIGEKQNMNDRKFTVRKSRKSTKKGPGGEKNATPAKSDVFGGYQVDPVEESNQKIAQIMQDMMQAEVEEHKDDEGNPNDQTYMYEDKVNKEEFNDLIAKTMNIMHDIEEESYDSEEEQIDPCEEREGEENLEDDDGTGIQKVMTKVSKISMNQLNSQQHSGDGVSPKKEPKHVYSEPPIKDDEFQEVDTALSVYQKVQELLALYRPNNSKLGDKVQKLNLALLEEQKVVVDHRKTIKMNVPIN